MAHCARIENGIVVEVIVISNDYEPNVEKFATDLFGGHWLKTSYNGKTRKNFAGIGYSYDETRDAFIPPKANCHNEEILDEKLCLWVCNNAEHTAEIIQKEVQQ